MYIILIKGNIYKCVFTVLLAINSFKTINLNKLIKLCSLQRKSILFKMNYPTKSFPSRCIISFEQLDPDPRGHHSSHASFSFSLKSPTKAISGTSYFSL